MTTQYLGYNLDLIKSLKEEVADVRRREIQDEKAMETVASCEEIKFKRPSISGVSRSAALWIRSQLSVGDRGRV